MTMRRSGFTDEDDGPTHGCLGCLIDGHDHSCGFVAINAPRTTWNTSTKEDGCDCTELCSMGPTCPGGMLAGLPDAGCWRTADPRTHGLNHAPLPGGE